MAVPRRRKIRPVNPGITFRRVTNLYPSQGAYMRRTRHSRSRLALLWVHSLQYEVILGPLYEVRRGYAVFFLDNPLRLLRPTGHLRQSHS